LNRAEVLAYQLLKIPWVQEAIEKDIERRLKRAGVVSECSVFTSGAGFFVNL
jgi:hypothetical protein